MLVKCRYGSLQLKSTLKFSEQDSLTIAQQFEVKSSSGGSGWDIKENNRKMPFNVKPRLQNNINQEQIMHPTQIVIVWATRKRRKQAAMPITGKPTHIFNIVIGTFVTVCILISIWDSRIFCPAKLVQCDFQKKNMFMEYLDNYLIRDTFYFPNYL